MVVQNARTAWDEYVTDILFALGSKIDDDFNFSRTCEHGVKKIFWIVSESYQATVYLNHILVLFFKESIFLFILSHLKKKNLRLTAHLKE